MCVAVLGRDGEESWAVALSDTLLPEALTEAGRRTPGTPRQGLRILPGAAGRRSEGTCVSIFPDYTQMVQEQRKSFVAVKQILQGYNLKNGLLFLAKLWVPYEVSVMFFYTPAEANDWLYSLPQLAARTPVQRPLQNRQQLGQSTKHGKPRKELKERPQPANRITVGPDGTLQVLDDPWPPKRCCGVTAQTRCPPVKTLAINNRNTPGHLF
ncbi:hypothetical protein NDU88_006476 [Pleurodeles waltl]|uniref:Uncharacterized protein n=1 Tax=Pleurodeles waltl TaxID=8319 RepID=A0AAV7QI22_PLEWA|nr:hypothetical protein NDU88_006476 [Pleurodeles waltl]